MSEDFYRVRRLPPYVFAEVNAMKAAARARGEDIIDLGMGNPARRQGIEHARTTYALADRRLGEREWAIGRYSIADIHLFRLFWRFRNSLNPAPGEFPNLVAHYDRMMERPAVQRTIEIEAAIGYELPA